MGSDSRADALGRNDLPGLHLLLEGGAERMRRIDPEDLQLLGEERQLLERQRERAVVWMAFDVGIAKKLPSIM